ncbi:MAG: primosomal protein N' [Bacteroidales bacterium]|nr:primosomal protein N' [Bacteroidales bacterium]
MSGYKKYVDVILPLKLRGKISYAVPEPFTTQIKVGSWVMVRLIGRRYLAVVEAISDTPPDIDSNKVKEIESMESLPIVEQNEMDFWRSIAEYYMCSVGEIFKAAYSVSFQKQVEKVRTKKEVKKEFSINSLPELSVLQQEAYCQIGKYFEKNKIVLLNGVTGSGKTEIYIHLAQKVLEEGKSVLYMVPEIALSRQLNSRLEDIFGEKLMVYHSKQTSLQKKKVFDALKGTTSESGSIRDAKIILGTRSSVFLPFNELGLVIIDEEHDSSYKQSEPAPRYNGRDAAIMLATKRGTKVILGSATPSMESFYNVTIGKYVQVDLCEKYHGVIEPEIEIIDTNKAYRLHNMKGSFSMQLINQIASRLELGEQVMIFRSRRSYSPIVQCSQCGAIPKCPHCNVSLSYHKFNNSLVCHYCNYKVSFTTRCPSCGEPALDSKGAGTEKIEEELNELFPNAKIARFDADTTSGKVQEQKILKDFAGGKTDILVGTQMITKGFDFERLSLVAVINADALFSIQDFRADERSGQLLQQLRGRAGRREKEGKMIIQTAQPDHPVLQKIGECSNVGLKERKTFGYPPYVRMVLIIVKDKYESRLWRLSNDISSVIKQCGIKDFAGPISPQIDKIQEKFLTQFWIKLPRNRTLYVTKKALYEGIEFIKTQYKFAPEIIIDVDPY